MFTVESFSYQVTDPNYGGGYVWQHDPNSSRQAIAVSIGASNNASWQSIGQPPTAWIDGLGDVQVAHGALTIPDDEWGLNFSVIVTFYDPAGGEGDPQVIEMDGVRVTVERISE